MIHLSQSLQNLQDTVTEALESVKAVAREVKESALADNKTPLGNDLALHEWLAKTTPTNLEVVVFGDLNRFKGLNDRYGHRAGDTAIGEAGELIYRVFGQKLGGKAFRPSGDEFVILLPNSVLAELTAYAREFAAIRFKFEAQPLKTAMSFGYAVNDGPSVFAELLARAELACQSAKAQGDGVCLAWTPALEQEAPVNLRQRCAACGAKVSCNVPRQHSPLALLCCPFCRAAFDTATA